MWEDRVFTWTEDRALVTFEHRLPPPILAGFPQKLDLHQQIDPRHQNRRPLSGKTCSLLKMLQAGIAVTGARQMGIVGQFRTTPLSPFACPTRIVQVSWLAMNIKVTSLFVYLLQGSSSIAPEFFASPKTV